MAPPKKKINAAPWAKAKNSVAVPAIIKCKICLVEKPKECYSKKQLSELSFFATRNQLAESKIRCRGCTGAQQNEMKCSLCREVKGLGEFSKAQRREPDNARCLTCMASVMETEPGAQIFDNVDEEQKTFFGSDNGSNPFTDNFEALSDRESIPDDDDDDVVPAQTASTNHGNVNQGNANQSNAGSLFNHSLIDGLDSPGHGGDSATSHVSGPSNTSHNMGYPHLGAGIDTVMQQPEGSSFIDQLRSVIGTVDDNKSVATEAATSTIASSSTSVDGGVKLNTNEWKPRPRQGHGMSSTGSLFNGHASSIRSKHRVPGPASSVQFSDERQPGLLPYKSNGQGSEISASGFVPTPVKENIAGQDNGLLFTGHWARGPVTPEIKSSVAGSVIGDTSDVSAGHPVGAYATLHVEHDTLTKEDDSLSLELNSLGNLPLDKGKGRDTSFDQEESLLGPWTTSAKAAAEANAYRIDEDDHFGLLNSTIVNSLATSVKKVSLTDRFEEVQGNSKGFAPKMAKTPSSESNEWSPIGTRRKVAPKPQAQPVLRKGGWAKVPAGPKVSNPAPYAEFPPPKSNRNVVDDDDSDDGEDMASW